MAVATLDIGYSQVVDPGTPGQITLNGQTLAADGRLDNVGDTVSADGFTLDMFSVSVECTRTSSTTMQVRLILTVYHQYSLYYCAITEKVIDGVPLSFP